MVAMDYEPKTEKDMAGMVYYLNESNNYELGVTCIDKKQCLVLQYTEDGKSEQIDHQEIKADAPLYLQIESNNGEFTFRYSYNGTSFTTVGETLANDTFYQKVSKSFTGILIGLHATSRRK